jgi:hypothetical protein
VPRQGPVDRVPPAGAARPRLIGPRGPLLSNRPAEAGCLTSTGAAVPIAALAADPSLSSIPERGVFHDKPFQQRKLVQSILEFASASR